MKNVKAAINEFEKLMPKRKVRDAFIYDDDCYLFAAPSKDFPLADVSDSAYIYNTKTGDIKVFSQIENLDKLGEIYDRKVDI